MLWFDGSIRNAVDKVKSTGVFFMVFVQGEDSLSRKYETYLNEEAKYNLDDFVAVKIPHDSVAFQQFKQIYVSVPVPSVFLIQNNGVPLKVVSSSEISDLQSALSEAVSKQKLKQDKKNKMQNNKELLSVADNNNIMEDIPKPLRHAKNIGRKITDASEEEIRNRLKEIRGFPRFWLLANDTPSFSNRPPAEQFPMKSARIQFRLPNNTMPSWEFPDRSTLADVRAYIMEKMKLSSDFKLLRTYTRTPFTPQDEGRTLTELSLTPSATLVVVPVQDKTVQAKLKSLIVHESFFSNLLNTLLQPLFTLLKYFKKYFLKSKTEDNYIGTRRIPSDTVVEKILNKKTSTSNIHGFKFEEDTDTDTEHPDNGNSTQQRFQ